MWQIAKIGGRAMGPARSWVGCNGMFTKAVVCGSTNAACGSIVFKRNIQLQGDGFHDFPQKLNMDLFGRLKEEGFKAAYKDGRAPLSANVREEFDNLIFHFKGIFKNSAMGFPAADWIRLFKSCVNEKEVEIVRDLWVINKARNIRLADDYEHINAFAEICEKFKLGKFLYLSITDHVHAFLPRISTLRKCMSIFNELNESYILLQFLDFARFHHRGELSSRLPSDFYKMGIEHCIRIGSPSAWEHAKKLFTECNSSGEVLIKGSLKGKEFFAFESQDFLKTAYPEFEAKPMLSNNVFLVPLMLKGAEKFDVEYGKALLEQTSTSAKSGLGGVKDVRDTAISPPIESVYFSDLTTLPKQYDFIYEKGILDKLDYDLKKKMTKEGTYTESAFKERAAILKGGREKKEEERMAAKSLNRIDQLVSESGEVLGKYRVALKECASSANQFAKNCNCCETSANELSDAVSHLN
eukprot:Nk52_evm76s914 gene=Nk52_evmTU76s914